MSDLADWEIQTIDALAREAMDKRIQQGGEIRNEDAWLGVAIRERQTDATTKPKYRLQLQRHAERLGIGNQHPHHDWEADTHQVASKETSSRWARIGRLVVTTDRDHPWHQLHDELATRHVTDTRLTHLEWDVPDEGLGILQLLEDEARLHGLIDDTPAPHVDPSDLAQRLLATLGA